MAHFPLALSIEPRLLPLAVANGFHMDSKVRQKPMFSRADETYCFGYSIVISSFARCSRSH
jgi:hypothetical protein